MDSATHLDPFPHRDSQPGEPVWDLAHTFPRQGGWSEEDYLALNTGQMIEFTDGCLEVLPMPTLLHQLLVMFLHSRMKAFVDQNAEGMVLFAPLPVRLATKMYREPDIVYIRPERISDLRGQPNGADLVVEVVSEGSENRKRDLERKPQEYAVAGIPEFWIVDPEERHVRVLTLQGNAYQVHGEFAAGDMASSVLLAGFEVSVDELFAAGEQAA